MGPSDFDDTVKEALKQYNQNASTASEKNVNQYPIANASAPVDEPVYVANVPASAPVANVNVANVPVVVAEPVKQTGGRKKRTRKLSYKRKSRQNRNKRARRLTKRNLLL